MDCFHKASLLAVRIYMRDQVRGHGMETGENRGIQEEYSVLGFSYWKPGRALLYIKKTIQFERYPFSRLIRILLSKQKCEQ